MCITKNRFRYTSHGREANRTIKNMILPDSIPDWIYEISTENLTNKKSCIDITMHLTDRKWKYFQYSKLFTIEKGTRLTNAELKDGDIPCIRAISHNNGIDRFIDVKPNHTKKYHNCKTMMEVWVNHFINLWIISLLIPLMYCIPNFN